MVLRVRDAKRGADLKGEMRNWRLGGAELAPEDGELEGGRDQVR